MSMGGADSMASRYSAPLSRLVPFIFVRDQASERRDSLQLAGLLILTPWPKRIGIAGEAGHPEVVAAVMHRLVTGRARIDRACWVEPEKITPAAFDFQWLRRRIADHATLAVRLADDGADKEVCNGIATSRLRVAGGRLERASR
jgi:hypothetical protein